MSNTHIVIPDQHADPRFPNDRADWIGQLIKDVKPNVVVNLGDSADMASLSSYDKGKRSFQGRSYSSDLASHLDFQERMWDPVFRTKKKLPYSVVLEGNHEHRIERALDLSPELTGTIGFKDLAYDSYYNDVVRYDGGTPGIIDIDGISYAHYCVSGVMGMPSSGLHPAAYLNSKQAASCIQGHTHTLDFSVATTVTGRKIMSMVAGCAFDYSSDWAGNANRFYWRGVIILHDVENGTYDPEFISLERLRRTYGA